MFFPNKIKWFIIIFFNCITLFSQVDNAKFINQSVPDRMAPGESYNLIVTFENTGTTYWVSGDYRLRVTSGDQVPSTAWSTMDMDLTKVIEPGHTASFEVKVTAPSYDGVYHFYSQLLHGSYLFGESSSPVDITVSRQVAYKEALNSSAFVEETIPSVMNAGRTYKVMISMTNTGKTVWTPGLYRLVMLDAAGNAYTGSSWNTYSAGLDESIYPS